MSRCGLTAGPATPRISSRVSSGVGLVRSTGPGNWARYGPMAANGSNRGSAAFTSTSSSAKTGARASVVTTSTWCPAAARARSSGSWARPWEGLPSVVHRTRMG